MGKSTTRARHTNVHICMTQQVYKRPAGTLAERTMIEMVSWIIEDPDRAAETAMAIIVAGGVILGLAAIAKAVS